MTSGIFRQFIEKSRNLLIVDSLLAIPFLVLPLVVNLPYRVNIFLSWEGAYRMYLGQVPFVDFGLPMGFGYWILPWLSFELLGPNFLSLIFTQVVINLISLLALRGLLSSLHVRPIIITSSLLVFSLTYVIYNFWPWYNHTVVVFELVALYFAASFDSRESKLLQGLRLIVAGFFTFLTFYTKQDVGGIAFLICVFVVGYIGLRGRKIAPLVVYIVSVIATAAIFILPFVKHDFLYWFNFGQPPHSSRISAAALLDVLLAQGHVEKIYILIILVAGATRVNSISQVLSDRNSVLTATICVALILQSIVTRVTSPLPTDHMTYFHTFGFIGLAMLLPWERWEGDLRVLALVAACVVITYSGGYWKYVSGYLPIKSAEGPSSHQSQRPWVEGSLPTFSHVVLPQDTNEGIRRIMNLPFLKKADLKVLNMSELTSLAKEIGYVPLTNQPLWYHLNIGMFQKEVDEINTRVKSGFYDLVLFEDIPSLNNFYPYATRAELARKYVLVDRFLAPRRLEDSWIEVFIHPGLATQFGLEQANGRTN